MLPLRKQFICPYCGYIDTLLFFMIKKTNGSYNTKFVKCPDCNERMRINTLINDMDFYIWGLWLYLNIRCFNSKHNKFYDRIDFHKINFNLSLIGRYEKTEFYRGFNKGKTVGKYVGYDTMKKILNLINDKYNIFGKRGKQLRLNIDSS